MNFRQRVNADPASVQLAPMIDIVFLLLIFFIVTWNFARNEMELDVVVPTAKEGKNTPRNVREVIINVRQDGTIVLNRQEQTPEALLDKLKKLSEIDSSQAVILRAHQDVEYKYVVRVLDLCRNAGIWNVAFATAAPEPQT